MTLLSQFIERFPHFGMALAKLVYGFRQLFIHAGRLPVDAMNLDESLPVADLRAQDMLDELASFLDLRHGQRKIDLLAFASSDDNARRSQDHGML